MAGQARNKQSPRLLEQVRDVMRREHYSISTERNYIQWIKRFIYFHNKQHPKILGAPEIEAYLTYLARKKNVAPSTQNQTHYLFKVLDV